MKKVVVLMVAGLLLSACSSTVQQSDSAGTPVFSSSPQTNKPDQLPATSLMNIANKEQTTTSQILQEAKIINFWASWCTTCRKEYPLLADKELTANMIGINVQDASLGEQQRLDAFNLLQQNNITFSNYVDVDETLTKSIGIVGLPVTIVVDKTGNIIERFDGPVSRTKLEQFNDELRKLK